MRTINAAEAVMSARTFIAFAQDYSHPADATIPPILAPDHVSG